jgi:hypothetical protein
MNLFFRTPLAAAALLLATAGAQVAQAADYTFAGNITYHNDVVQIDFAVANTADVKLWTDSWLSGLNFDPTAALWLKTGNDFQLLQTVDDDDTVAPGQGYYDAGFNLPGLAAGSYRVTLAAAINAPLGMLLSQGFSYSAQAPILLSQWNQPSYDPNANDQKGGFWQLHVNGVSQAAAVPEPAEWLLLATGLLAVTARRRRAS